jgi:hypothetical protein
MKTENEYLSETITDLKNDKEKMERSIEWAKSMNLPYYLTEGELRKVNEAIAIKEAPCTRSS